MPTLEADLIDTKQVAFLLHISPRTVCLWAECSELPAIKVGRAWRFKRHDIALWLQRAESKGASVSAAIAASAAYKSSRNGV